MVNPRFGILTAPQQVSYADLVEVWRDADAIPALEHAWLFDHLLPIHGDANGPVLRAGRCCRHSRHRLRAYDWESW